jgi:DNA repair and recombination protein RAD52
MFNDNQIKTLKNELDSHRVKTREKGNIQLSYLEGFDIIETANSIFGFGNWDYAISKLEQVSSEINQNQNNVICYKAIVQVLVHSVDHANDVSREDVGFGTGVAKTQADAHEGAAKEAVTDAIKRCFRSFGNQFGNSLYDKSRNQNISANIQNHTSQHNQNYNNPQNQQSYQNPNNHLTNQRTNQGFDRYEFQSLYNLGLDVVEENNGYLIVMGDNQYAYRDAIKASGFKFDPKTKTWWRSLEQGAA